MGDLHRIASRTDLGPFSAGSSIPGRRECRSLPFESQIDSIRTNLLCRPISLRAVRRSTPSTETPPSADSHAQDGDVRAKERALLDSPCAVG
jgi:hypothetical protein